MISTCRELGIAFGPFSPLGRGVLTGALEVSLTAADLARLDEVAPRGVTAGERYNTTMASGVDSV